ncbi:DUF1433 domain-containing protein [Bacillus cytotoxicus]|uniref:DUF1433 domain-containing protein n=1 Tax=Bacillus cereus group sp. BfR-BA-01492 TaxID=2920361 RepID=UPI001F58D98A|nr:DUF1433 domain-containing protein [Bacillus cereus group sp. BfR-BA-01492]EMA6344694.1 DUF1433 domain-containing protein [Bacillus cytotoxicus]
MGVKIQKCIFLAIFFLVTIMIGGCNMGPNDKEQQIVEKASEVTINYFKEKENLEVTITNHRFPSNDIETVFITGHIKNDKNKKFTASIDYNAHYSIGSISTTNFNLKH